MSTPSNSFERLLMGPKPDMEQVNLNGQMVGVHEAIVRMVADLHETVIRLEKKVDVLMREEEDRGIPD